MPSRRLVTVLAAGLVPLALTACGSGRSPEAYAERATVDAATASLGDLEVRNVTIKPPSGVEHAVGSEATATMYVVNMGEAPDRLTGVSTAAATSVEVLDADGAATTNLDIPPLKAVGDAEFSIRLQGLTRAIRPGQHVEMTFTFLRAGRQTLIVPVAVYDEPVPRTTQFHVFDHHEGGEAETEGEAPAEG